MISATRNIRIYIVLILGILLSSCVDELPGADAYGPYPEGDVEIEVSLDFEPFAANSIDTRSLPGKTMSKLDDLCLVAYSADGTLMEGFPVEITKAGHGLTVTDQPRGNNDASNGLTAESSTKRATFKITLPYGQYYLYALSNLGTRDESGNLLTTTYQALQSGELAAAMSDRQSLLDYKAKWDEKNPYNNFEMLGYFTEREDEKAPFTGEYMNQTMLSLRSPDAKVHCWLRRCAAKVTIDFDGSQLNDNVRVYIKRATIHDIPRSCSIGSRNAASSRDELISNKKSGWSGGPVNGNDYRPTESADYIEYASSDDYHDWPRVANGSPYITDNANKRIDFHSESANALFLYENMQGESLNDKENKLQKPTLDGLVAGASEEKDLMECGSYIEVEGYYDYAESSQVAQGKIYYRFMLGKDELKDFNVERNHHYKITMCFRGRGNDVDWHIEYDNKTGFEFRDPYYVSYIYNHESTIHFRFVPEKGKTVKVLTAQIVGNNWWPDNLSGGILTSAYNDQNPMSSEDMKDPLNGTFTRNEIKPGQPNYKAGRHRNRYLGNGFLSLRATEKLNIEMTDNINPPVYPDTWTNHKENEYMNDNFFYGNGRNPGDTIDRSWRAYYFDANGNPDKNDKTNTGREQYNIEKYPDGSLRFNIPVFTRVKNLVKETAYSGNNPYEGSVRSAYVRLTIKYSDNSEATQIVRVQQVKRVTNPKGIYRRSGNNENFRVRLMELSGPSSNVFDVVKSNGPWMAEVLGDANFINLNGRQVITGATDSDVDFNVRFNKMNTDKKVRNAVIRIRYNNYTCIHLIFVRQGYDAQELGGGTAAFYPLNMIVGTNIMCDDPRDEGSLFKYGNLDDAIDVKSNAPYFPNNPGMLMEIGNFTMPTGGFYMARTDKSEPLAANMKNWKDFSGAKCNSKPGPNGPVFSHYDSNPFQQINVPEMGDYVKFYTTDNILHGFGILYADGATDVAQTMADACGWYRHEAKATRDRKGMRGVFVYYYNSKGSGNNYRNIFFPIGRSGFGHRRAFDDRAGFGRGLGVLRYAAGRCSEMPTSISPFQPQFYDLYRRQGAIYWAKEPVESGFKDSGNNDIQWANTLDLNYYTFDVSILPRSNLQKHSMWSQCFDNDCLDACFLRLKK